MPLWPFPPQESYEELLEPSTRVLRVGPRDQVSVVVDDLTRRFRLRYTTVTASEAMVMEAFYRTQFGALVPFDYININDQLVYQVRFDPAELSLDLFEPTYLRAGGEIVLTVVTS